MDQQSERHDRKTSVKVNEYPVVLKGSISTGKAIKEDAVRQGAPIEVGFVLVREAGGKNDRIIGDDEAIDVHDGEAFWATKPRIEILVNKVPVVMEKRHATGAEIKAAAIAQGVKIDQDFVLSVKDAHEKWTIIGDDDTVDLHDGEKFMAVAPEDHS
jgi:hypothetical protein